jgi:hypothetical protein
MKKIIFLILGFLLLGPFLSLAQINFENPLRANSLWEFIDMLINFLYNLALVGLPGVIVFAGILFMTSAGEATKIRTAKNVILYSLIGFVIILISKGIIQFLRETFLR